METIERYDGPFDVALIDHQKGRSDDALIDPQKGRTDDAVETAILPVGSGIAVSTKVA